MSAIIDEPRTQYTPAAPEPVFPPDPPRLPSNRRRSHPGRLLAAGVAAVVVVGGALASVSPGTPRGRLLAAGVGAVVRVGVALESVPPGTPGHQLWTSIATAAPLAGPPVAAAPPRADPPLTAIQQVMQQAHTQQAHAT